MIDDGIFKSLWHRRKIAFASECLPSVILKAHPWGAHSCSGGQRKLGQIKVIKDLQINNAFILDLLTQLRFCPESAERWREAEAEMNPDPTKGPSVWRLGAGLSLCAHINTNNTIIEEKLLS